MNPNSQHQRWSKWVFMVVPPAIKYPTAHPQDFDTMRAIFARMARKQFGSNGQAHVEYNYGTIPYYGGRGGYWIFQVIADQSAPHDPLYVARMHQGWVRFFGEGFGPGTRIRIGHRLLAGDWQDGKPSTQLLIADLTEMPDDEQGGEHGAVRSRLRSFFRSLFRPVPAPASPVNPAPTGGSDSADHAADDQLPSPHSRSRHRLRAR